MKIKKRDSEKFRYATVCVGIDFEVVLVAESVQQLARSWRALTMNPFNAGYVDVVKIEKED